MSKGIVEFNCILETKETILGINTFLTRYWCPHNYNSTSWYIFVLVYVKAKCIAFEILEGVLVQKFNN